MQTPPLLITAALLFWGYSAGSLMFAIPLAIFLEGSRLVQWRWEINDERMVSISNLCLIILGGTFAIFAFQMQARALQAIATWLPVIFAPLMAAQAYSVREKVTLKAFFMSLRWQARKETKAGLPGSPVKAIDVSYIYFGFILMAACAGNPKSLTGFGVMLLLLFWALFADVGPWQLRKSKRQRAFRPRAPHPLVPAALVVALVGISYIGPTGLFRMQQWIEHLPWYPEFNNPDLRLSHTRLGDFQETKMSGKILYRVKPVQRKSAPPLLQEASFSEYFDGTWRSSSEIDEMQISIASRNVRDSSEYFLQYDENHDVLPAERSVEIAGSLSRHGQGVLPLPAGTTRLRRIPAIEVKYNGCGTVRVEGADSPYNLIADYSDAPRLDAPPISEDLSWELTPGRRSVLMERAAGRGKLADYEQEMKAIAQLTEELGLHEMNDMEKLRALRDFFQGNFTYSLNLSRKDFKNRDQPIRDFLTRIRRGHCEYFATATVLLLRAAGVPARYATGYSVQEYSAWEQAYRVRSMHGHAWTLAYVGGQKVVDENGQERWEGGEWVDFDTTPSVWLSRDSESLPGWQELSDVFNTLWHKFSRWRAEGGLQALSQYIPWIMGVMMLAVGGGSLLGKRSRRQSRKDEAAQEPVSVAGELTRLEEALQDQGLGRDRGETVARWLQRLRRALPGITEPQVREMVSLHYQDRFSANPVSRDQLQRLRELVEQMMQAVGQRSAGTKAAS